MEALTRFSIERWRLTLTAILLILFSGAYTYLRQPSQEDPEIVIRTAVVTVAFPGMSASRVEQLLIKPVEEAVKQIPEADVVRSSAQTGLATVKVELLPTVTNTRPVWDNLRNKMTDLAPSLPAGAVGPLVNDDYGRVAVTTLALTGADFSMAELRAQARWLRDRLSTLSLVSRIDLFGVQDERIWLTFNRSRLSQLGISSSLVLNAIAEQNQILPAGSLITEDGMRYALEPSGDFRTAGAIGDVRSAHHPGMSSTSATSSISSADMSTRRASRSSSTANRPLCSPCRWFPTWPSRTSEPRPERHSMHSAKNYRSE